MTKFEKALENIEEVKRIIMENSCPSYSGQPGNVPRETLRKGME